MQKSQKYTAGKDGKILWSDLSDWDDTVASLQSLGYLNSDFDVSRYVDSQFVTAYYENNKP